ncbi:hypothetical protein PML78_01350 [Enterococcus dispar]|uniref:hypothetical protein n=1 Tax=Enterococcus dispar TaxID=44009 RepID=UPI00232D0D5C|nr:hypothetical protein [Enterococcus dispar]WCG33361.1 hypothetical protein PML78_01350 [Enterococcus dispar]
MTLPEFPTVDFAEPINWMVTDFTGLVSSNATLVIGAGLAMAVLPIAIMKIKGFAKKAIR